MIQPTRPASLAFDFLSLRYKSNPYPVLANMIEAGPVFRGRLPLMGKSWLVTTHEAISEMLRDQDRFVRDPANAGRRFFAGLQWWMPRSLSRLASNMLAYDGDKHRRLRSLVDVAFRRRSVEQMKPQMLELADRLIDEIPLPGSAENTVDLVPAFARQFPLQVICELLGLPQADRHQFIEWFRHATEINSLWGLFRLLPGIHKMQKYLARQIEEVRQNPRPGLLSELVQVEQDGDSLDNEELLAMVFLLLVAGHETTVHLISTSVYSLCQHPAQRQRLCSDWSLVDGAIDEVQRHVTPIQFTKPRMVSADMTWHDQPLRRGELVTAILAAGNADPTVFGEPEKFDICRENAGRHLTFGTGPHTCLGMQLAKAETAIALEQLFTRFPQLQLKNPDPQQAVWTKRLGVRGFSQLDLCLA